MESSFYCQHPSVHWPRDVANNRIETYGMNSPLGITNKYGECHNLIQPTNHCLSEAEWTPISVFWNIEPIPWGYPRWQWHCDLVGGVCSKIPLHLTVFTKYWKWNLVILMLNQCFVWSPAVQIINIMRQHKCTNATTPNTWFWTFQTRFLFIYSYRQLSYVTLYSSVNNSTSSISPPFSISPLPSSRCPAYSLPNESGINQGPYP